MPQELFFPQLHEYAKPYAPHTPFLTEAAASDAAVHYSSFRWIAATLGVNASKLLKSYAFAILYGYQQTAIQSMLSALREWSSSFTEDEASALVEALKREALALDYSKIEARIAAYYGVKL